MNSNPFYCFATGTDPVQNLAMEAALLETVKPGECILYLWQNQNTVVIGRNQNSTRECRADLLAQEGGTMVRRLSGGGAVYHDLGNLNFTFLATEGDYDLDKQLEVILRAVRSLGIPAEKTGRNDLTVDGRKFSGNAFYQTGAQKYHHGTILVNVNAEKMGRYLNVAAKKLQTHGVASVRSRVVNLSELVPGLSITAVQQALLQAFGEVYGRQAQPLPALPQAGLLAQWAQKLGADTWRFGTEPKADTVLENRYPWGGVQLLLAVQGGKTTATMYTDAMDERLASEVQYLLCGLPFSPAVLCGALHTAATGAPAGRAQALQDIAALIKGGFDA